MRVMITGADGFIGSHLTELILSAGHQSCILSITPLEVGVGLILAPSIRSEFKLCLATFVIRFASGSYARCDLCSIWLH